MPCVAVLNKVDKVKDKASLLPWLKAFAERHDFAALVPVSAEKGVGLEDLSRTLLAHLPEGEPQYSEDDITDRSERFLVAEMIREQLMRQLGEELPYASTVEIEQYREEGRLLRVSAVIWVEREGQKGIVVGAGGQQMRAIGQSARMAIEGALFVARTRDGGESWEQLREGLPQENAFDVVYRHALANTGECLAFGSTTGNLYVSEDRGDRWETVANNLPPIYSVRFG